MIRDRLFTSFKTTHFVLFDGKRKPVIPGEQENRWEGCPVWNRVKKIQYTLLEKIQVPKFTGSKIYSTFEIYRILPGNGVQGNGKRICTDGTIIWQTYGNQMEELLVFKLHKNKELKMSKRPLSHLVCFHKYPLLPGPHGTCSIYPVFQIFATFNS